MKTLHVHIGTPKTGTTSIQNFCADNEALLTQAGYCYPVFPYHYPAVAKLRNGHFLFGKILDSEGGRDKQKEKERYQEGIQRVHELFQTYHDVILSDEDIWRNMDDTKKTLWTDLQQEAERGGFRIHVIVYLRRQDKFYISNWNQNVKLRMGIFSGRSFADFLEKGNRTTRLEYYQKLERIAGVIGKEHITVRRFEGGHFEGGSIYADFLSAVGLSLTDAYQLPQEIRNTGLYGNTHEIKRVLNSFPQMASRPANRFFTERLREVSEISNREYPSDMMSKEETEAFLELYRADNKRIAEEYLGEKDTELFDYTVKELPKWQKDNPYMYDDLIRFAGVTAISLFDEGEQIRKDLKELSAFRTHVRHPFRTLIRRIRREIGV